MARQQIPTTMRGMPFAGYGTDAWKPVTMPVPELSPDRMLVEVRAAGINPFDLHTLKGGFVASVMSGFKKPTNPAPGSDAAGVVVAVGPEMSGFQIGDEVFGGASGSLAQCASAKVVARKPSRITWEQAAAIPIAGLTALQGLRDKGKLQPGQSVLINGASGGVGTFAVQIAKAFGGEVTGVCGPRNIDMVRSLGADHVFDYTKEDFAKARAEYDLVLDLVGNRSLRALRHVLKPDGTLVLAGGGHQNGHGKHLLKALTKFGVAIVLKRFVRQRLVFFIAYFNSEDMATLALMIEQGKLTPEVDRTYTLDQSAEAFEYFTTGHARAKIVVTMTPA